MAAPTPPTASVTPDEVGLSWDMPAGVFPSGCAVYRNAGQGWQLLDRIDRARYEDASTPAGTMLAYEVPALDVEGNEGGASVPVTISVPVGAQPLAASSLPAPAHLRAVSAAG